MTVGAGLLVFALVVGAVVGALWGVLRPAYEVVVRDGGALVDQALSPANVEFSSFGWFVILSAVLGLVVALVAYARLGGAVSLAMMAWVVVAAAAGAFAVHTFGSWSAGLFSGMPSHDALVDGARFQLVPPLHPGVAWLCAPFVAALVYWLLALVTPVPRAAEPPAPAPAAESSPAAAAG